MKVHAILIPLALCLAGAAETPAAKSPAIAILEFQRAVLSTREGQQISAAMKAKFDPRRAALEKRQNDLKTLQQKLQAGGATLTEAVRAKMQNDLTNGGRALTHDVDELNTELQEEEGKAMQSMAGKMGEIIKNYATQHGFTVVLDASGQNTPVLWAAPSANITNEIVKLYDAAHPANSAAAPKPPAKK